MSWWSREGTGNAYIKKNCSSSDSKVHMRIRWKVHKERNQHTT